MPRGGKRQIDGFGDFSAGENFSRRNGDALFSALPIPAGGFPTIANRRRHIDEPRKVFRVFGGYSELAVHVSCRLFTGADAQTGNERRRNKAYADSLEDHLPQHAVFGGN